MPMPALVLLIVVVTTVDVCSSSHRTATPRQPSKGGSVLYAGRERMSAICVLCSLELSMGVTRPLSCSALHFAHAGGPSGSDQLWSKYFSTSVWYPCNSGYICNGAAWLLHLAPLLSGCEAVGMECSVDVWVVGSECVGTDQVLRAFWARVAPDPVTAHAFVRLHASDAGICGVGMGGTWMWTWGSSVHPHAVGARCMCRS